jgi:S-adenosylmethionine:tRNA ribosyltransferase-isomerase
VLTLDQFHYTLPEELIAQTPMRPRDASRLLVLDRHTTAITHHRFSDLVDLLSENDVLVRNNTKVIPARIFGTKDTGGNQELLLIKRLQISSTTETWQSLGKPGLKLNQAITFAHPLLKAVCVGVDGYTRDIHFNLAGHALLEAFDEIGHTPLPPYIRWNTDDEQDLRHLYQTTYAKVAGSAAAPTAGLHFTPELDAKLSKKGIQIEEVTLHVGLGTFLRVKKDDISQHQMHQETYEVKPEVADRLNAAKAAGKRIIAVGTTTTRVLETCTTENGVLQPGAGETQIFVYPPQRFKFINGLITNFHEPQSTLLMLVSAFTTTPNTPHQFRTFLETPVGQAYTVAIQEKYRFHSFGDGMLIWDSSSSPSRV